MRIKHKSGCDYIPSESIKVHQSGCSVTILYNRTAPKWSSVYSFDNESIAELFSDLVLEKLFKDVEYLDLNVLYDNLKSALETIYKARLKQCAECNHLESVHMNLIDKFLGKKKAYCSFKDMKISKVAEYDCDYM